VTTEERISQLLSALASDPKLMEKLERSAELDNFKSTYNVERATPLKCPACASIQRSPGSLWINKDDKSIFTCRKCRITYQISTKPMSTDELIIQLRKIHRGDEDATLNWDMRLARGD